VLNLLINALGRDLLLLVGLVTVMLMQDPYMALLGFLVAPPAMLVLRKLVKRIKGLAHNQFTGTADILETMQESLQGIRTVKAFTLEQTMRQRIDASIAAVEAQRQQDGAGFQPFQPADGNAGWFRCRGRTDVRRL
jgi:ABC-type multidrug transport system fused ATPase/permease subunit